MFAGRCFCVRKPSATVGSTTAVGTLYPCLWGVLQKWPLWRFQTLCNLVASVALPDIPTCFITRQKIVLCDTRNTVARFSEDDFQVSWHAQHFGCVHLDVAWQAQHFRDFHVHFAWQGRRFGRVVLRVFANRSVRAASSGDNVQIAWQAWHFGTCDENGHRHRMKRRF